MPLTPQDVSNKRFTPVRLREGYDMGEVDQFLDEVETELDRLLKDNEELRTQLGAGGTAPDASATPADGSAESTTSLAKTPAAPSETIRVETVPQASNAAARLLEIATRNADQLVDEAKDDADRIVGEARTKADRLDAESKERAEREEAESRQRVQRLDQETEERRVQLFGDLEKERDKLGGEVETLRSFEREYRSRLRGYFQQQLESLDGSDEPPASTDEGDAGGRRLRSILGDDQA